MVVNAKLLGEVIKERRKALGLKQNDLAERVGVSQGYIADLENGKKGNPTVRTISKLAEALQVYEEEFLHAISGMEVIQDTEEFEVTEKEQNFILRYRKLSQVSQQAIDALMDHYEKQDTAQQQAAAKEVG